MHPFILALNKCAGLSVNVQTKLKKKICEKSLMPGEYLLRPGEVCRQIYFLKNGRLIAGHEKNGVRHFKHRIAPGDLFFAPISLMLQEAFCESISAAEYSTIQYINLEDIRHLRLQFKEVNYLLLEFMGAGIRELNRCLEITNNKEGYEFLDWTQEIMSWMKIYHEGVACIMSGFSKYIERENQQYHSKYPAG